LGKKRPVAIAVAVTLGVLGPAAYFALKPRPKDAGGSGAPTVPLASVPPAAPRPASGPPEAPNPPAPPAAATNPGSAPPDRAAETADLLAAVRRSVGRRDWAQASQALARVAVLDPKNPEMRSLRASI